MSILPMTIKRHQYPRIIIALLAMSLIIAACGNSTTATTSSNTPTTITFWSWVPNVQAEVTLYEKAHPNVHVNVVNAGQGAAQYTKLTTALKAGQGAPDVVQIEYPYLPQFILSGKLADLSQYGANSVKDQFVPWTWSQASQNGKVYAIPQDSGPMGFIYRNDLLAKYNLPIPQTWDQFAQEAKTFHQDDPSASLTQFSANDPNWFFSLLWQAGSQPFQVSGTTVTLHIDDAAALKVADYWGNLINSKAITVGTDFTNDWYTALSNGTYASWVTAAWGPGFLSGVAKNTSGKWRAAQMPQWTAGASASANWGGSTDAVTTQSKNPQAATDFAIWLNTNKEATAAFVQQQSLFPTTTATLSDPVITNATSTFFGGQQVNKLYGQTSAQINTSFQWSPFTDYVYSQWINDFGKAINGSTSYEQAMHKLQTDVTSYATSQGFTVK